MFGTLLAVASIACVSWVIGTYAWLAWIVLAGMVAFVVIGTIVLAWSSRERTASSRGPAPLPDSRPFSGGLGPSSSRRSTRPRRVPRVPQTHAPQTPTSQGLGGNWQ